MEVSGIFVSWSTKKSKREPIAKIFTMNDFEDLHIRKKTNKRLCCEITDNQNMFIQAKYS